MNNESYDDYIRSVLGYPMQRNNMQNSNMCMNDMYANNMFENNAYTDGYNMNMGVMQNDDQELEDCYPEIYKIVYPMVRNACMRNTRPATRQLVDEMTDEIYFAVENNNEINISINLQNEMGMRENRSSSSNISRETKSLNKEPVKTENRGENRQEEGREDRQFRNRNLRDLIRILLIRELLRRRRFPGHRPGMPPFPGGRPPFPGIPGRPPMMPRGYNNMDMYEQY